MASALREFFGGYSDRPSLTDQVLSDQAQRTALLQQFGSVVEPYEPSLSERLRNYAFDLMGGNEATGIERQRIQRRAGYPQKIIDQTFLAGITDYSQAMQDYARGDALSGTANMAMAATSFIPGQQRQAVDEVIKRITDGSFGRTLKYPAGNVQVPFRSPISPQTDVPQIPFRSDAPVTNPSALRSITGSQQKEMLQAEPESYQWMRNAEGGQEFGNQQIIAPIDETLYNNHIRKLTQGNPTFTQYQAKYPDVTHISLIKRADGGFKPSAGAVGTLDDLRPSGGINEGWAVKVDSFDSDQARLHGATADSDVRSPIKSALDYGSPISPQTDVPVIEQSPLTGRAPAPQTGIINPQRMNYPGIYKPPQQLVDEANAVVAPESSALRRLFNVSRQDLYNTATNRTGNVDWDFPGAASRPKGAASAASVMTDENARRISDALIANRGTPLEQGMTGWYVMDPAYQRLEAIYGPEKGKKLYERFNIITGIHSANADVVSEFRRGSAANMMADQGRAEDYMMYGGLPAAQKQSRPDVPDDLRGVAGHMGHKTSHGVPFYQYATTGLYGSKSPKVPTYIQAGSVPEIGFQTNLPVGDAHFSRGLGLADVRTSKDSGASWTTPEGQTLAPWFKENIADTVGMQPVSTQANMWGLMGPQTGVKSQLGAPKLEILADEIMIAAERMGVSPEEARDLILAGKARLGPR